MAATFDSTSNSGALNASSASWAHTLGGGSNLVLIVAVGSAQLPATSVSSISYGAQSLAHVTSSKQASPSTAVVSDLWYLIAPSGNQTISITMSASGELYGTAVVFKDADQVSPLNTAATSSGSQSSPASVTNTVSSATDQAAVAIITDSITSAATITVTTGTQRSNLTNGSGTSIAEVATIVGSASAAFAWSISDVNFATDWSASGVSVKPFVAGTPLMGQACL